MEKWEPILNKMGHTSRKIKVNSPGEVGTMIHTKLKKVFISLYHTESIKRNMARKVQTFQLSFPLQFKV